MSNTDYYQVSLGPNLQVKLPLIVDPVTGFKIYSFMPIGKVAWNETAAKSLYIKAVAGGYLKPGFFEVIIAPEAKVFEIAHEFTRCVGHEFFIPIRKSRKLYMQNPTCVTVNSITSANEQHFWLGEEEMSALKGKRVCLIDDVVSTGGTVNALIELSKQIGFTIVLITCALTEGEPRTEFQGVPLISLDHLPLP